MFCGEEILTGAQFIDNVIFDEDVGKPVRQNLTRYVKEVSEKDRRKLLFFCTSSESFSVLHRAGADNGIWVSEHERGRLPTASTCYRKLTLPNEPDFAVFRERLNLAVAEGKASGFQLE